MYKKKKEKRKEGMGCPFIKHPVTLLIEKNSKRSEKKKKKLHHPFFLISSYLFISLSHIGREKGDRNHLPTLKIIWVGPKSKDKCPPKNEAEGDHRLKSRLLCFPTSLRRSLSPSVTSSVIT